MMTTYTVEGRWPFPLDMLRYDEAKAATPADQELIDRLTAQHAESREFLREMFKVTLTTERSAYFLGSLSAERWKSFGWRSSRDETPPPAPAERVCLARVKMGPPGADERGEHLAMQQYRRGPDNSVELVGEPFCDTSALSADAADAVRLMVLHWIREITMDGTVFKRWV